MTERSILQQGIRSSEWKGTKGPPSDESAAPLGAEGGGEKRGRGTYLPENVGEKSPQKRKPLVQGGTRHLHISKDACLFVKCQ